MRVSITLLGVSVACLIVLVTTPSPLVAQTTQTIDYQKIADGARWAWTEPLPGPIWGTGNYGLQLTMGPGEPVTISILSGTKAVYSWTGNFFSIYQVIDDHLYYIDFVPTRSGGTVVAVDLKDSKVLWRSPLKGLSNTMLQGGTSPLQRFHMDVQEPVLLIQGWEAKGKYFEIKNLATGETVGHKIFPHEDAKP